MIASKAPHQHSELEAFYQEGETVDQELYAEQRSNIRLVKGLHWANKGKDLYNRVRNARGISQDRKLRLTKNHLNLISRKLVNAYLKHSPDVTVGPKNDAELQDQKSAELNKSVLEDIKIRHDWSQIKRDVYKDFTDIGEVFYTITWNPTKGKHRGEQPEVDEMGQPVFNEDGQPIMHDLGFTGDFDIERVLAFNIVRDAQSTSINDARWLCVRKLVNTKDLKKQFAQDDEKLKMISDDAEEAYKIFDTNQAQFTSGKGKTLVKTFYFKPGPDLKNGYYYITTSAGILHHGELPLGLFPVLYAGCHDSQSSARCYSIIKQLRPIQIEINRCYSNIATNQITMQDTIFQKKGDKLAPGSIGSESGPKVVEYNMEVPTVVRGASGAQYLDALQLNISELYKLAAVDETEEDRDLQLDPYQLLYRSMRFKARHITELEKLESFFKKKCELLLELAKAYYPDDMLVPAIGSNEIVNIPEFRSTSPLNHQIKVVRQSDDAETQIGKQIVMNHALQYVGPSMTPEQIGLMMRSMPFGNSEKAYEKFTIDHDNITNDILAMDRGDFSVVEPDEDENHEYVIKELTRRIKRSDFKSLNPQIQQAYYAKRQKHREINAKQADQIQRAKSGFIPMDGHLISCDMYYQPPGTNSAGTPKAQKRVRLPSASVKWLIEKLEDQQFFQEGFERYGVSDQAAMAQLMMEGQQQPAPSMEMLNQVPPESGMIN